MPTLQVGIKYNQVYNVIWKSLIWASVLFYFIKGTVLPLVLHKSVPFHVINTCVKMMF